MSKKQGEAPQDSESPEKRMKFPDGSRIRAWSTLYRSACSQRASVLIRPLFMTLVAPGLVMFTRVLYANIDKGSDARFNDNAVCFRLIQRIRSPVSAFRSISCASAKYSRRWRCDCVSGGRHAHGTHVLNLRKHQHGFQGHLKAESLPMFVVAETTYSVALTRTPPGLRWFYDIAQTELKDRCSIKLMLQGDSLRDMMTENAGPIANFPRSKRKPRMCIPNI